MDKKELEQLEPLRREIIQLQKEIDHLPLVSDTVSASSKIVPYQKHTVVLEGVDEIRVKRLKRKLERRKEEYMDMVEEIEAYIATINDSMIRQLITCRFINRLSWNEIAAQMGYGYTPDQLRMKLERFFQKN